MKDENAPVEKPTFRKPVGVGIILLMIFLLAGIVANLSDAIGTLPGIVQAMIYMLAGIIWIAPLGPLLRWMETGKWRA